MLFKLKILLGTLFTRQGIMVGGLTVFGNRALTLTL